MSLEDHIQTLQDAYNKIQTLRQLPQALLKTPTSLALPKTTSLIVQSQKITDIAQTLKSDKVQEALRAAKASQSANGLKGTVNLRRENRKRRRAPSPESPQPYVAPDNLGASLFPPPTTDVTPLKAAELFDYIHHFNREHSCTVHIWRPMRTCSSDTVDRPTTLRFCIRDILTAFITVNQLDDTTLITESVAVFGPREQKPPHSQSDYFVYQSISQQATQKLHSHPQVPLQTLLDLLCAYEGIFIDRCTVCERVLSPEGHIPPVVRLWTQGQDGERGKWESRHVNCRLW
ncbi:hypothetical protein E1B28_001244 [Marasmius oreades]|uniref:Mediator complex subunit 27 n=1 Tax=Marasmius oreades TaxID=181124 RepID=A0A9P8AFG1_9AGAR|nr:uncharacterized protein E1B28_001244 [Marasmius oreades]KAG7099390.1 hypothetical protein E1B28_001244 [Marasmius oreades]